MSHSPSESRQTRYRLLLVVITFLLAAALYQYFDLGNLLTLDNLKNRRDDLIGWYTQSPVFALAGFFIIYVVVTALSLPGAAIMTLAGGAIFGFWTGLVLVSFASSLGALLAFLVARYLLRDSVQNRFGKQLAPINEGIRHDGAFYLFTLRLVPLFPFFAVNLLAGLTPIGALRYYWVSQLGMLAGTAVYINAGTQLASIQQLSDILSPTLLASFILLGVFPLLAKKIVTIIKLHQVYANWKKPKKFDRNMVVIGAGAGGLVTAYIGAAVKAKVSLVESHKMGGDCLNYGCVPSKALIRSAKLGKELRQAESLGFQPATANVDFAAVMERIQRVIAEIEPHDSVERYSSLGVDVINGYARITSPWEVEIKTDDGVQKLTTRNIVIATGASPFVPPVPGLKECGYLTSDTVWSLRTQPERLVIMGGGPIGCELAQSFSRLGSRVSLVEMLPRLMMREDPEISTLVAESLRSDGVEVLTGHQVMACANDADGKHLVVKHNDQNLRIHFDELLCAVGRSPRTTGFGLEELGISLNPRKTIEANDYLQTRYPNIYAVGDVVGPYQLTHTAGHQGWYAAINALFGRFKRFKVDYSVIPWTTFTDPEVARVGLSENEAKEKGIDYELTRYDLDDLDRAIADGTTKGFVKVLTAPGKDRILGATIVGEHAGDLLAEYVLAMKHGIGLNKILGTIHTYPTLAEANKQAASQWRQANQPQKVLRWVEKFHRWERA